MFLDYSPLYQSVTADSTIDTGTDEEEEEKWWEDANFWLMFSSIVLAVVLIIVMLVMLIRKMIKNYSKKPQQYNRYDAKRAHYMKKLNLKEEAEGEENETPAAEPTEESGSPDEDPYND